MQHSTPDDAGRRRIWSGAGAPAGGHALRYAFALLALLALAGGLYLTLHGHGRRHRSSRLAPPPAEASATGPLPACGAECDPIDRRYLTDVRFGRSSFWIQPWRAYLDTWPASRLRDALGINFNVSPAQAAPVARLLHESGFALARIGIGWDSVSYDDPGRLTDEGAIRARLSTLRRYQLRPLIVLDSNSVAPCP